MYASTIILMSTTTVGATQVGIGTAIPQANLGVYNTNTIFTTAPTVHIGDGAIDNTGGYGMLQLTRLNSAADNKAHLAFIKQNTSVFGMGFFPSTTATSFGLVPGVYTGGINMSSGMWLTPTGNVGIGITLPTSLLHIYGPPQNTLLSDNYILNVTSASSFNGNGSTTVYSNSINLQAGDLTGMASPSRGAQLYIGGGYSINSGINHGQIIMYTGATERMRVATNGNVGIGTVTPANPLHVIGSATLQGSNCSIKFAGNSDNHILTTAVDSFGAGSGTNNFVISSWYGLGFGNASSSHYATAYINCRTGTYYGVSALTSDKRMKKNIQPSTNCLDRINSIPVVSYDFIESHKPHVQYGVVAQDVRDIVPEAVSITSNFIGDSDKIVTHIIDGDTITITSPSHGYHTGDVLRFTIDYANTADDKFHTTEITVIDDDTFTISKWDAYDSSASLYVYGKYVHDFHNIDTSHFTFLAIGGIKEQHATIVSLEAKLAALEARLAAAGL